MGKKQKSTTQENLIEFIRVGNRFVKCKVVPENEKADERLQKAFSEAWRESKITRAKAEMTGKNKVFVWF